MRNFDQKAIKRIEGLFFNKKKPAPTPPDLSAFNSYVRGFDPWSGNYRTLMLEFADGSALLYPSEYSEFKDYVIVDQNNNKIPGEEQVAKYIPNLLINSITIEPYTETDEVVGQLDYELLGQASIYKIPGANTAEYTAKLKIDYTDENKAFGSREFVIINI
jgi:hypothetical protein